MRDALFAMVNDPQTKNETDMRFLWILCFLVAGLAAQAGTITVTGEGQVATEPDLAWISIGVREVAPTAAEATQKTADAMASVIARLSAMGIDDKDLQTQGINLNPVWDNRPRNTNEPPKIIGYAYATTLQVRVRDLDKLGDVLDGSIGQGANAFHGLRFDVDNPRPAQDQARKDAVADAFAKARLYTEAAGVGLGAMVSLSEGHAPMDRPDLLAEAAMMRDQGARIATGEVTLVQRVTLVFETTD